MPRLGAMRAIFLLTVLMSVSGVRAQVSVVETARRDVQAVAAMGPDRSAGTTGARQTADYFVRALEAHTGQRVYRQPFTIVVPVVERCEGREPGETGRTFQMWPLTPAGGQPSAIAGGEATAKIVYGGAGSLAELKGKPIAGNWVALKLESGKAWETVSEFGAKGIIFLGSASARVSDFLDKATTVPMGVPRFYSDDPALAAAIQEQNLSELTIAVKVTWKAETAENLFCIVPGRQQNANGKGAEGWINNTMILQAPYDATSQVLGRAPGAQRALSAAAIVELAARASAMPERRSVLVLLTSGDEWLFHGMRQALELLNPEDSPSTSLAKREAAIASFETRAKEAATVLELLGQLSEGDFAPIRWRPIQQALRDEIDRQAARVEQQLQTARLNENQNAARDERATNQLNQRKRAYLSAAPVLTQPATSLTVETRALLQNMAGDLRDPWQRETLRRQTALQQARAWLEIRQAIGEKPFLYQVGVDLTAGSPSLGLFNRSHYAAQSELAGRMSVFERFFERYLIQARAADAALSISFDVRSAQSTYSLESFFPVRRGFASDMAVARGLPGGTFAAVADASGTLDTPNDTADRINWDNAAVQLSTMETMLLGVPAQGVPGALTDHSFYGRRDLSNQTSGQIVHLYERGLGEASPRLGAAEHVAGIEELSTRDGQAFEPIAGVRAVDWALSDIAGAADFTGLPRDISFRLQAFGFDGDGVATRALAAPVDFQPDEGSSVRGILFDCHRLDLFGLFDPRYLEYLDKVELLDARRQDKVQETSNIIHNGIGAVFMPPDLRWQLLVSKGQTANRMVLLNADEDHPAGQGFATVDRAALGPLAWRTAHDLYQLDSKRKRDLERFGISNDIITQLHDAPDATGKRPAAAQYLRAAREAKESLDYGAWLENANAAWALEINVYGQLLSTSNGVIYGVIFLLLGLLPFSYFLERLLIASTDVYRQIGGVATIFAAMTGALWFHPAFRISTAPAMILLAFLILTLSGAVVWILLGKFEEEIVRLQGAAAAAHKASLKRSAVFGAAVRLGLSNMRRRGTRTTLTLITLVLLTFTLLCFTSVRDSFQLTPRILPGPGAAKPGLLLRQFGWTALPPQTEEIARQLAGDQGTFARRYWYASSRADVPWFLPVKPVEHPTQEFVVTGLVGLDPQEAEFQENIESVLPGWPALAAGENVCFLSNDLANGEAVQVGDHVNVLGYTLTVAGFFDPAAMTNLKQLTGEPLTPLDPSTGEVRVSNAAPKGGQAEARREQSYRFLSPRSVIFMPASIVQQLGGRLSSLMIRPANAAAVTPMAEDLARRSAFVVYASQGRVDEQQSAVRSYNAAAATSTEDFDRILVPMLLAGVIVLNTMFGAVSERTREIHVYTSLGLAPAHVGMLFLAEAAALGTLGVVFGYIFGQGVATVLGHFHLMEGVELNYSSLSAVMTMGMVLGLVMISSVWPARMATRVAAPSLQRAWKLPAAVGDRLTVDLPFTVNQTAARGICAFLQEFFLTVSQTGSGGFTADDLRVFQNGKGEKAVRGLNARIWLAPYDVGVTQNFWMAIYPTPDAHVFEVQLTLVREAGNPAAWRRLNRPFLVEVRKQFLLWRTLSPELIEQYVQKSDALFANAQPLEPPTAL